MYGYYADGASIATAVLPEGWEHRLVPFDREDARPSVAMCVEPHDLVVSKLVAERPKDLAFAAALIREGFVDPAVLLDRVETIPRPEGVKKRLRDYIRRCTRGGSTEL